MVYRELQMFDKAAFGVIKIDMDEQIVYSNDWMCQLIGRPLTTLDELVTDPESRKKLDAEISKRGEGSTGEYVLTIETASRPLQVQVFGTPLFGDAGNVTGAVAFVTRASLDRLRDSILSIDVSSAAPLESLTKLREALASNVPFDSLTVAIYDENMEYSRVIFTYFKDGGSDANRWSKHWVKLTPMQRNWILESTTGDRAISNLYTFLDRPEWRNLRDNPMVAALRTQGIHSVAGLLVKQGTTNVASLTLLSKRENAYDENFVRELHQLPIDRCVLSVVNAIRTTETVFRYELLRRLAKCHKINELGNSVVNLICRQYRLQRVALFSIDWVEGCARLRSEKVSGGHKKPASLASVPLTEGLIADVAHFSEPQYVEDIRGSHQRDYINRYFHEDAGSVFCWPVSYYRDGGDKLVRWVFCAVDEHTDAFSPDERRSLSEISADIGGLLQRLTELHFMKATFDTTSDAILVVDGRHQVRRANKAAAELFQRDDARKVTGDIATYFEDADKAAELMRRATCTMEAAILAKGSEPVPAMVSSRSLPETIGGKVFAFEDLRKIKRLEELSFLGHVASEISAQIQTPLTLASSWVQRIGNAVQGSLQVKTTSSSDDATQLGSGKAIADLAGRTLMQLRRIQACLDRIALYDSAGEFVARPAIPLSLDAELTKVVNALPRTEQERVRVLPPTERVVVTAHPEHLGFVFDTLIAFFLRDLPAASRLTIRIGKADRTGWLACQTPKLAARASSPATTSKNTLTSELGLVEQGLRRILAAYSGELETERAPKCQLISRARIQLPLSH